MDDPASLDREISRQSGGDEEKDHKNERTVICEGEKNGQRKDGSVRASEILTEGDKKEPSRGIISEHTSLIPRKKSPSLFFIPLSSSFSGHSSFTFFIVTRAKQSHAFFFSLARSEMCVCLSGGRPCAQSSRPNQIRNRLLSL